MSESILLKAEEIINGQRAKDYGDARENHQRIADLWNVYLQKEPGTEITPEDVAVMMILLKIARFMENGYHHDTVIDIAGYAGVLEKMQRPKIERYPAGSPPAKGYTLDDLQKLRPPRRDLDFSIKVDDPRVFARQWDSRTDIPKDVQVRGAGGEVWKWYEDENSWLWSCQGQPVNYGHIGEAPFTEILARHDQKEEA